MVSSLFPPRLLLAGLLALTLLAGCGDRSHVPPHAARVGDQYLSPDALDAALQNLPAGIDSAAARRQVIRQWTTRALLYREAQRRALADDPDVRERLEKSRQSVLVNALLGTLYDEMPQNPSHEALQTYFERHREALRFSVPHVRARHLSTDSLALAQAAHRRLQQALARAPAGTAAADTAWAAIAHQYAADTAHARRLAADLHPEPTFFSSLPAATEQLHTLEAGQLAPVFEAGGRYHVLQLIERVPAGTLPELDWVKDEIRQRLLLQRRKQTYARQVERLRTQARSNGELEGLE